ncbi:hypothetical protein GBA52_021890 [Prunus armeniaca]|nr:hypothetical protein GBA52_021890 [Prunus armeniaca]
MNLKCSHELRRRTQKPKLLEMRRKWGKRHRHQKLGLVLENQLQLLFERQTRPASQPPTKPQKHSSSLPPFVAASLKLRLEKKKKD